MQVIKKIFCTNNKVSQVGEYWVMLITFISFDFPAGERGAKCIIALSVVPTCLTNVHSFYSLQVVQFPVTCIPTFLSTITGSGSSKSWKARLGFVDWFFFCPNCQTFWIRAYRQTPFGRVFRNSGKPEISWNICAAASSCVNHQTRSRWNVPKSNWG